MGQLLPAAPMSWMEKGDKEAAINTEVRNHLTASLSKDNSMQTKG